jgi:receptor-type tyrosine-protein phosphatase Q
VKGAHGKAVVDKVVKLIQGTCVFKNDKQFLRRVAWVESKFGDDPNTFRMNNGIWQVDEIAFKETLVPTSTRNQWIQELNQSSLHINYRSINWNQGDLKIPLLGGLASRFYMAATIPEEIPWTIEAQAQYWKDHYNTPAGSGTVGKFIDDVGSMPEVCDSPGADILFILDSSGSIGGDNWDIMLNFVATITNHITPFGKNGYQFAVDIFSYNAYSVIAFNGTSNATEFVARVKALQYIGGSTGTAGALRNAVTNSFTPGRGMRPSEDGYPKVIIVLTDGISDSAQDTRNAADMVHEAGIQAFTVGLGNGLDYPAGQRELQYIASAPKCMHWYLLTNFAQLSSGFPSEIKAQTCKALAVIPHNQTTIANTLQKDKSMYFQFTANYSTGISFQLSMSQGATKGYFSITQPNPSAALYDYSIDGVTGTPRNLCIPHSAFKNVMTENDEIPVYASLTGLQQMNNFTLKIADGSVYSGGAMSTVQVSLFCLFLGVISSVVRCYF